MLLTINTTPKNISGIYKINYPDGKIYIGQAINIRSRLMEHNQRAFNLGTKRKQKCDQELFNQNYHIDEYELLEEIDDYNLLDESEKKWIKQLDATNPAIGLNILEGGNAAGKRGLDNPNSKLTEQTLSEIQDLLINRLDLSQSDIANQYNLSQNTILNINSGKRYFNLSLSYPLRNDKVRVFAQKDTIDDYNLTEKDLIEIKEDLKYRWDLTIEEDLVAKYNIPLYLIRDINQGRKFSNFGDYNYPIRDRSIRNNIGLTQQDVINILNDLRNTTLSQTRIGEKYCIHRNTVAKINLGEAYIIKDYNYPARTKEQVVNNYSCRKTKRGRSVRCLNTNQIFNFTIEAAKWCNISESCIRACANGKQKTAGKHPQTKEPLKWKWIE